MVRNFDSRSDIVHPRNLGVPPRQLPMGIRSDNTPNEEKYRYSLDHTLLCAVHQSADNRFVVYGKEHGGLGWGYGYYCHYPTSRFLWNWDLVKGESSIDSVADDTGGFPFLPLVDRLPGHGRYRAW